MFLGIYILQIFKIVCLFHYVYVNHVYTYLLLNRVFCYLNKKIYILEWRNTFFSLFILRIMKVIHKDHEDASFTQKCEKEMYK